MKAFASWSGGKDCMLAVYKTIKSNKHQVEFLLNMTDDEHVKSRSHGISKDLIVSQAHAMGIDLLQQSTQHDKYEVKFKEAISLLKEKGIEAGIFGDIYLEAHRVWIERVCKEMDIKAIFPLWGAPTKDLLKEFIDLGFKTILVAINKQKLSNNWVGRIINQEFYDDITKLDGIDPCAELGEYHSFVFDGPTFSEALKLNKLELVDTDKTLYQTIEIYTDKV